MIVLASAPGMGKTIGVSILVAIIIVGLFMAISGGRKK
jgi:hypothetical protein